MYLHYGTAVNKRIAAIWAEEYRLNNYSNANDLLYISRKKKCTAKLAEVFQIPYCSNTPDVGGYFIKTPYNATITTNHIHLDSSRFLLSKVGHHNN